MEGDITVTSLVVSQVISIHSLRMEGDLDKDFGE